MHVEGDLDLADALDLDAALAADAHQQLLLGSTESLDVRRSIAAGNLARNQQHPRPQLDADDQPTAGVAGVQVVLHVHLERRRRSSAPAGSPGSRRPPARSPPNRSACGAATPTPRSPSSRSSTWPSTSTSAPTKPPPGSRLQTQLRDLHLRLPLLLPTRRAVRLRPPGRPRPRDDGGPTCTCNLAPACRGHHRAKTTGGWTYVTVEPGVYLWRSPLGYQFLSDHTGTLDVTPDAERRRLAREFRAHFGDPRRPRTLTTPPHTPLSTTRAGSSARCRRHGRAAGRQRHDRRDVRSDRLRDDQSWAPRCGLAPGPAVVVGPVGRGNDAIADHDPGWACVVDGDAPGVDDELELCAVDRFGPVELEAVVACRAAGDQVAFWRPGEVDRVLGDVGAQTKQPGVLQREYDLGIQANAVYRASEPRRGQDVDNFALAFQLLSAYLGASLNDVGTSVHDEFCKLTRLWEGDWELLELVAERGRVVSQLRRLGVDAEHLDRLRVLCA